MVKKNILRSVIFMLPITLFALAVTSWSQNSNTRSAKPKGGLSAGTGRQANSNWSAKQVKPYLVKYLPVAGKPVRLAFEPQGVKDFQAAVKAKNKERIDEYLDFVSSEFENAKIECCEKRTKISSCVWTCCDGSKVDTCSNTALTDVVTLLWKKAG